MSNTDERKYLGVELGSTRIKVAVINDEYQPVASGGYTWKSSYEDGIWTYNMDEVWTGLKSSLEQVAGELSGVSAMGISGMMHGYLAFDSDWNLLVPFRTWQNTITGQAAAELTELFGFNIPQRWSVAHLYQAVLNGEEHVSRIAHITTLAGYVHYMLTGVNAVGIGEASGMFPIDCSKGCYDEEMLRAFDSLTEDQPWKISALLPEILVAGEAAGELSEEGAQLLGGVLPYGIAFAPAEGDAGTGMTATNAVAPGTGNVSAGTSIFSMVVLEKPLAKVYEEIDIVTTPAGHEVGMVHCNNCTNDFNAWESLLSETVQLLDAKPASTALSDGEIFDRLFEKSLSGEPDCGGVLVCNYMAGEGVTHLDTGRPMVVRRPDSRFTLANFLRASLYSTMATLKMGMDILAEESVSINVLTGHGGLFKAPMVGQKYMAAACNAPITCMKTAGEGGPYGMALLAAYGMKKKDGETLSDFLNDRVFGKESTQGGPSSVTVYPEPSDVAGFNAYMVEYKKLLQVERAACQLL